MDSHSKNVCLIGALYIVSCIIFCIDPLSRAIYVMNSLENDNVSFGSEQILPFCAVGFYLLLIIFSGLMIHGVIKQRYLLMTPFLLVSIFNISIIIIFFVLDIFGGPFNSITETLYNIGVQIIVIYPVFILFKQLRSLSLKEKSLEVGTLVSEKKMFNIWTEKL